LSKQVATKLSKREYEQIRGLVRTGMYINSSDFVRDAVRRRLSDINGPVKNSPPNLKELVYRYLKEHDGLIWPDAAAKDLGYSVLDVLEALHRLEKEGKAMEAENVSVEA